MRIVYFGTAAFAVPPLRALIAMDGVEVLAVVTQPDKPAGRKGALTSSPVAVAARADGLALLQPATLKADEVRGTLAAFKADLFVVAAYGKIVPRAVLDLPRLGCLNLHGSILPKYRGASPIQAAILEGERETGVSLMVMDEQVDHGPVIATVAAPIADDDTHATLEAKLGDASAALLMRNLRAFTDGTLKPAAQDHAAATLTSLIAKEDGLVDWAAEDAARIERKSRAYDPWPGAYFVWTRGGAPLRVKILAARVVDAPSGAGPGACFATADGLPAVAAKTGAVALRMVQPEGKKPMPGDAFLNGYKDFVGTKL